MAFIISGGKCPVGSRCRAVNPCKKKLKSADACPESLFSPFYSQKERSMVSFSTTIGQLFSARTHKIANCNKKWNSRMVKFVIKAAKGPR